MLKKDLRRFEIYPPIQRRDAEGAVYNEYGESSGAFMGNIQPVGGRAAAEKFGVSPARAYAVYTAGPSAEVSEMCRIGDGRMYEVRAVRHWGCYRKIDCEEVLDGESD